MASLYLPEVGFARPWPGDRLAGDLGEGGRGW